MAVVVRTSAIGPVVVQTASETARRKLSLAESRVLRARNGRIYVYPKGVWATAKPPRVGSLHRGACWNRSDLTLMDGSRIDCHVETSWGENFYFLHDGLWRHAAIDLYARDTGRTLSFDLRDARALKAFEAERLPDYHRRLDSGEDANALCALVEEEAERIGYTAHAALKAFHTRAESLGVVQEVA